ncbi:MAG: class I SAM-dependent methyltransferase [Candidatus Riflebacteria bacterium]|nr:class I SAM-dependent methyltransferase [Candidatus Riflebacteria bacterium]
MKLIKVFKTLVLAFLKKEPRAMDYVKRRSFFLLAQKIAGFISSECLTFEFGKTWFKDRNFVRNYRKFYGKLDYSQLEKKFNLFQLANSTEGLIGNTAECGAYRGASSFFICLAIVGKQKTHHVFDSFEGLSQPGESDGIFWEKGYLKASEAEVAHNLSEFDFCRIHKAWIPKAFPEVECEKFSFLHIDVDLYQPTFQSLEFFYPRMVSSGLIVCDDYGFETCPGAQKAFDGFFLDKPEKPIHLSSGQAFVIKK